MSAIVELKKVSKSFEDSGGSVVLSDLDFAVESGDRIGIIGPSGCGKSTLLNLIGTLDRPTSGVVKFLGQDLAEMDDKKLAKLRADEIGFIFQLHHLLPQCSVLENVLVPTLATKKFHISESKERAQQLLERVGLSDHLAKRPGQLSGGERQRVSVVRALINQPKLLLADEPTGALDEENASKLVDLLIEVCNSEGVAMVMVTHSIELAKRMRVVKQLKAGQMV